MSFPREPTRAEEERADARREKLEAHGPARALCSATKEIRLALTSSLDSVVVRCGRLEGHVQRRMLNPYTHVYFGEDFSIEWLEPAPRTEGEDLEDGRKMPGPD